MYSALVNGATQQTYFRRWGIILSNELFHVKERKIGGIEHKKKESENLLKEYTEEMIKYIRVFFLS